MSKRIGILTGGGDCPGLNAVIRAVVKKCLSAPGVECLGILRGWRGLMDGLVQPLNMDMINDILPRGGTILRTSRSNPFRSADGPDRIMKHVAEFALDAVVCIGGNDALTVASRLHDEKNLNVVGVPKTIDNDVCETEYCFGFDSTVNIAMEAIDRIHTTAESHDRVMVVEVMGRMAGWIAIYSGLASGADIILIPEKPVNIHDVCNTIIARHDQGKDFSIVVVAEGVRIRLNNSNELHQYTFPDEVDEFGHPRFGGAGTTIAREIQHRTGYPTRVTVLGHIQRGGPPTAFDRVLGTRFGVKAAELAVNGHFGTMTALQANRIVAVPLAKATEKLNLVPEDFYDVASTFLG